MATSTTGNQNPKIATSFDSDSNSETFTIATKIIALESSSIEIKKELSALSEKIDEIEKLQKEYLISGRRLHHTINILMILFPSVALALIYIILNKIDANSGLSVGIGILAAIFLGTSIISAFSYHKTERAEIQK